MSVSKLESLPNELFIEIFEKYLDGVDVLAIFSSLNNERFKQLIPQCRQWSLDFRYCRKDSFRLCLDFPLENLVDKIEELFLSDENTPGQISQFFLCFPSFTAFKRLRKLSLYINSHSADWSTIAGAIRSLSETPIDTISLEITNTEKHSIRNYAIEDIISLRTIKRFSFTSDAQPSYRFPFADHSSPIEYLTYSDAAFEFQNLSSILECCSHLKYLDVKLMPASFFGFGYHHTLTHLSAHTVSTSTLHTLILSFMPRALITMDTLGPYLRIMPALRRLEIKAVNELLDAHAWQNLLETSLPLLSHFRLKSTTSRIARSQLDTILASFETPFWIEKIGFYLIITEHKILDPDPLHFHNRLIDEPDEFTQPVIRWWIVPTRARIDDIPTKDITHIGTTIAMKYLCDYYYFKNIKHLVLYDFDSDLLQCLIRCVNYSGIDHLDVSAFDHRSHQFQSLLSYLPSLTSLRIQYQYLLAYRTTYAEKTHQLISLDISVDDHTFSPDDILTITKLFPNLECLSINTRELSNVPMSKTYLPHLHTLTFPINNFDRFFDPKDRKNFLHNHIRQNVRFSFRLHGTWMTVWIDDAVFEDPYWKRPTQLSNIDCN